MASGVYADLGDLVALEHAARGFSFLPRQPVRSLLAGRHGSRLRGRGLNFEEIRRYLPGDDVRSIDWKVTARTRTPHSRVYTEERERPVLLLVDQRQGMFFGSRRSMKSVTAAEAAALAAWRVLAAKDRVGALVFGDRETVEIRPHRSRATVMRILAAIVERNRELRADAPGERNAAMLDEALRRTERLAAHDALICLISDADGAGECTGAILGRIARHNDVLVGLVHDPLEAELPARAGRLAFADGGRQLEVETGDGSLRQGFAGAFASRVERVRTFLRRREIPVLMLSTAEEVALQIRRQLGTRQKAA